MHKTARRHRTSPYRKHRARSSRVQRNQPQLDSLVREIPISDSRRVGPIPGARTRTRRTLRRRTAIHLAPDALAGALDVPAPAVGEAIDEFQAAAVGLVAVRVPGSRRTVA